mgnify:FL=1
MPVEEWENVIKVNLTGAFFLAKACIPPMLEAGQGAMVLFSSRAAKTGFAALGSNGLVRTIRPVNTTADGDSLYAASVGSVSAELSLTGTIAAYVVELAIRRAVRQAESMYGVPAYQ